jgi:hypothetical protein
MLGNLMIAQAVLVFTALAAQQPSAPSAVRPPTPEENSKLASDAAKLTAKVLSSYYHPDKLPGLECDAVPDWNGFFKSANLQMTPDRMQAMQAMRVHVRAVRDQTPEITFNWTKGRIDSSNQVEELLKRTIDQFYQVYWNVFASPAVKYAAVISKIEPQPGGLTKVYESDPNAYVVMTVDKDGTPTHYSMQSPTANGEVDAHYARSPHPVSGDRRRISSVDVREQTGGSAMEVEVTVDYQPLDDYFVPWHVTFGRVGAYTMAFEFSGCSVTQTMPPAK